jgi:hypothetical protein
MHRLARLIVVACAGAGLMTGCHIDRPVPEQTLSPTRQTPPAMLSSDVARRALLDLVEQSQSEDLAMTVPDLKTTVAKELGNGRVAIGAWECDLINRRFVLTATPESSAKSKELGGAFKLRADQWVAVLELEIQK